jgi:hypothetical protein
MFDLLYIIYEYSAIKSGVNKIPVKKTELTAGGIRCADHVTPSIRKKLALTSPTSGGRSVGIVRLRTKGHGV